MATDEGDFGGAHFFGRGDDRLFRAARIGDDRPWPGGGKRGLQGVDDDVDGLTNIAEYSLGSNPCDPDTDGDTLTAAIVTQPAHGSVSFSADGSFVYTPDPDFFGTDGFTYMVSDGNGGTDTASVSITVTPVNDPPTAVDDPETGEEADYLTDEDTTRFRGTGMLESASPLEIEAPVEVLQVH